jgi:carbon monoxide dehydrogenase subunit G
LDFKYERTIAVPVSTIWDALIDPDAMTSHLPGTAKVVATGANAYRVSMKISMGFLRPTVNGNVQLSNLNEGVSFDISLTGKSMGAGVTGSAEVVLSDPDSGANSSRIQMTGSIQTSGLLNKIADSKIEGAATGFLEAFIQSIERSATG